MIRAGDSIHNPVTGERIVFHQTAADTDGEAVVIEAFVQPGGFVACRRTAGPFGRHLVGVSRIAVEQVAHDTLGVRHDAQDARVPIHAGV